MWKLPRFLGEAKSLTRLGLCCVEWNPVFGLKSLQFLRVDCRIGCIPSLILSQRLLDVHFILETLDVRWQSELHPNLCCFFLQFSCLYSRDELSIITVLVGLLHCISLFLLVQTPCFIMFEVKFQFCPFQNYHFQGEIPVSPLRVAKTIDNNFYRW